MATKQKFQIEYPLRVSPAMLYQYISTSSGLSEWFAEEVKTSDNKFVFIWSEAQEPATLIARRADSMVRFRFEYDNPEKHYFEMKIEQDELTSDVSLIITDFATEEEMDSTRQLWNNSVSILKKLIGA